MKNFTEKSFVIKNSETLKVEELDLSITNNGCGRKWIMEEGAHGASEKPYCDIVIKHNDSTFHAGDDYEPIYVGEAEIRVERMNPWNIEEDSIPGGGCRLFIKKMKLP